MVANLIYSRCLFHVVYFPFCRASACLFSAVENAYDAVEIRSIDSDKSEFQVGVATFYLVVIATKLCCR